MRRGPLTGTLSLLSCLNHVTAPHQHHVVQASEIAYSRSVLFQCTIHFCVVFPNRLDCRIYEAKIPTHISFFPIFRITLTFPSTFKTSLLFFTLALLSRYQSAVNCRGRNVREQLHIQRELPFLVIFWARNSCSNLKDKRTCPLKDEEMLEFSK